MREITQKNVILTLIIHPHVIPNPLARKLIFGPHMNIFLIKPESFLICIDRKGTTTVKAQKGVRTSLK